MQPLPNPQGHALTELDRKHPADYLDLFLGHPTLRAHRNRRAKTQFDRGDQCRRKILNMAELPSRVAALDCQQTGCLEVSGDDRVDSRTDQGRRTHHRDGHVGMGFGGGPQDLLDCQQVTHHSLIRGRSQRGVFSQGHRVARRCAIGHGARDDHQMRDTSGLRGDHHRLNLAGRPIMSDPGGHLEVGSQIRAGRHVDEGVDPTQRRREIGRVHVNQAPVHSVGPASLGPEPDYATNCSTSDRTCQQRTHDDVANRCRRTGNSDRHRLVSRTNPYPGGTH